MMRMQTTTHNRRGRTSFFAGAKLPALALIVGAAVVALGGGATSAAGEKANAAGGVLAADSSRALRFGALDASAIGGGGGTFADLRRQMQLGLFSQLDDALSQKAEDALTGGFAAVKKADIHLQTNLGGRKGQIGAHILGGFGNSPDSPDSAFGWQVRAYGGEGGTKGANAGLFVRRIGGIGSGVMFGGNVFVDYEDSEWGDFVRYGAGAEMANRFFAANANYYIPTSDGRIIQNAATSGRSVMAFSRKGYDANLRVNIPRVAFAKLRADFYRYEGKLGAKDDSGFRYGVELNPLAGLHLGVFYDDSEQEFGGNIGYAYTINSPSLPKNSPSFPKNSPSFLRRQESKTDFAPDLFAPVLREFSQRIITTAVTIRGGGVTSRL